MTPRSVRTSTSLVALLAAATLFALLAVNFTTLAGIASARPLIAHTQQVESALTLIRAALVDAETGQRGYLLTSDPNYLEPFERAAGNLPGDLGELKRLTAQDPSQQPRVARLELLASKKMEELRRTIDLHRKGEVAAAIAIVRTNEGKSALDDARRLIEDMRGEEQRLLEERTGGAQRKLRVAIWLDVGAGLGLLGLGIILFAIERDIARRRELERALREAMEFQERFVGILGHDLRNPLTTQVLATSLLQRRGGLSPEQSKSVQRIAMSAARMGRMVDDLLDLTRARLAGGIPIARRTGVDLAAVAREAVEELRAAHPEAHITLQAPAEVRGTWDADRLAQVISNLAGNAVQYSAGTPVDVRVHARDGSGVLEVHNGGPPIPAEIIARIFDPFLRGAHQDQPRSRGVGLGLFIAQQIVLAHGGAIDVRSNAAEGTTFAVRLPL